MDNDDPVSVPSLARRHAGVSIGTDASQPVCSMLLSEPPVAQTLEPEWLV